MKFLLIQLYQTGDVALTTHMPREIKRNRPDAVIDFLTFTGNKPVLENNPYINEILTTDRKSGFMGMVKTIMKIRGNRYDAVLDFHNNPRSAYMTFFSGAKYKTGYATSPRRLFYNTLCDRIDGRPGETKMSLLTPFEKNFDLKNHDTRPDIYTSAEADKKAQDVLDSFGIKNSDFLVTMSPTHKRDTRRWKLSHFISTAEYLTSEKGAKVILTYGPGERDYITSAYKELPENVFLMPELPLSAFIALIKRAKLHIGNDSAPHHIATAFKIPTFIIIGSTASSWVFNSSEHTWANLGMSCQPCLKSVCKISDDIPCMRDLTFDMIKERLEGFIQNEVKH